MCPCLVKISIKNCHLFITDGSSDIGLVLAHQAPAEGARVFIIARSRNKLEYASNVVRLASPDYNAVKRAVNEAGSIDVLLLNHGVLMAVVLVVTVPCHGSRAQTVGAASVSCVPACLAGAPDRILLYPVMAAEPRLLELQEYHVSQHVWRGAPDRILSVWRGGLDKHHDPPAAILTHLKRAGFLGVAHMGYCSIDHHLISALVERWRPETHTCAATLEAPSPSMPATLEAPPLLSPPHWKRLPYPRLLVSSWKKKRS
ncbi:hypothetical protein PIB30_000090 [Stylosanthes scabra]|uniref:Uncharacterized protein n=1 Tax=Stylosanthes scabra TaxID=79078 RepID=A0ABU6R3E0_9FABA|nr:hypothetical protein [Stylosanthes scabra]